MFIKALFALALPVGALVAFAVIYSCSLCKSKELAKYKRRLIVSFISFMFLIHPTITDIVFGLFGCYEIEDQPWLQRDMRV